MIVVPIAVPITMADADHEMMAVAVTIPVDDRNVAVPIPVMVTVDDRNVAVPIPVMVTVNDRNVAVPIAIAIYLLGLHDRLSLLLSLRGVHGRHCQAQRCRRSKSKIDTSHVASSGSAALGKCELQINSRHEGSMVNPTQC
jgi:hypothetical protein